MRCTQINMPEHISIAKYRNKHSSHSPIPLSLVVTLDAMSSDDDEHVFVLFGDTINGGRCSRIDDKSRLLTDTLLWISSPLIGEMGAAGLLCGCVWPHIIHSLPLFTVRGSPVTSEHCARRI